MDASAVITGPVNGALTQLYLAKLESSTLDESDARALSFEVCEKAPVGLPAKECGFKIPYFDIMGHETAFYRYRYLVDAWAGSKDATKKPIRYAQPGGSGVEIYLPPTIIWHEVAKDMAEPIVITEGELKAAAACKAGFSCIGLGGVWSWRQGARIAKVLKEQIKWGGRDVFICYDSDALNNDQVLKAEGALARELMDWGAKPRIVRLPPIPQVGKTGLDDLLFHRGVDALQQALSDAYPFGEWKALHEMNERVVFIKAQCMVVERESKLKMRPSDFTGAQYKNYTYMAHETSSNGKSRTVKKFTAAEWMAWPQRSQVQTIAYLPGVHEQIVNNSFNTWPGWGCAPKPGDISPWTELLDHLFGKGTEVRWWFECWCAYALQHPGVKMFTAVVLWSLIHGVGKSIIGETLGCIYGANYSQIKHGDIHTPFNEWSQDKQLVLAEEASGNDKRGLAEELKQLITQANVRINQKFQSAYSVPDCMNYLFTSNRPDALFLEDSDRRFMVHEIKALPLSQEFYERFHKWKAGDGPSHLFHYLLHLDTTGFSPRAPALQTTAKTEMQKLSKSDVDHWVWLLKHNPSEVLRLGANPVSWTTATTADLLACYDPDRRGKVTENGLARALAKAGIKRVRDGSLIQIPGVGGRSLWILTKTRRNGDTWEFGTSHKFGQEYIEEHGHVTKVKF